MIKCFVKSVVSVNCTHMYDYDWCSPYRLYCCKGEKYKVWNLPFLFYVFGTKRVAEDFLFVGRYSNFPSDSELITKKQLKNHNNIIVDKNGKQWKMASVHIVWSDNTEEWFWFETNEDADKYAYDLATKHELYDIKEDYPEHMMRFEKE